MRLPDTILLVLALTLGLVTALGGCSAGSARLTATSVPVDFTLEVRDASGDGALYIVEPDRWFRAATGATPDGYFYPPATRLLTPEQMEQLWGVVQASFGPDSVSGVDAGAGTKHPLWVQYKADHLITTAELDLGTAQAEELLAQLQALAWIRP